MLQTFAPSTSPDQSPPRLAALRQQLESKQLDAFLIPRADRFQGEYVAPADERLAWLTGFTGSAGFAVVTSLKAALFTDGRYTLQGRSQTPDEIDIVGIPGTKLADWLGEHLGTGRVAYDPWLHTAGQIETLRKTLAPGLDLIPSDNLVDLVWDDRPEPPAEPFSAYPAKLAGQTSAGKINEIADKLREAHRSATVLTQPDSLAWLLNIRGSDIPRNPVPHAMAILHEDGHLDLFAAEEKLAGLDDHFDADITRRDPGEILRYIKKSSSPVQVDPDTLPDRIATVLADADITVEHAPDPCLLPKARKTETELANTREAHLRDGAAVVDFLAWLDAQAPGTVDEITAVTELENRRHQTGQLLDISFETIAGSGPHGAIVHYRVTNETNRTAQPGELFLIDSGGQYIDGTTDITRTVPIGEPTEDQRKTYTAVLQGVIAISTARFPKGTAGRDLDPLARAALRRIGRDYDHGTGHGVGVYLSVHEGPQRLSKASQIPLEPGMILSNEPGYYRTDDFGIRLENLIAVELPQPLDGQDDRDWLGFETLTWVPFDRRLIDTSALARFERDWIDAYHAEIMEKIGGRVTETDWLAGACAPLTQSA
ncbi:aminopeptidase P family protein [Aestuariibius insulae]|uniref:aminopeptidase P family protein n=1 Tax=Aestuariibius insulae TaxID=2058287 RepID=UPI00398E874B